MVQQSCSAKCTSIYHDKGVLILIFNNVTDLKAALGRAHIAYEGKELRGPLKGVNFPTLHLIQWSFQQKNLSKEEQDMLQLIKLKHDRYLDASRPVFEKQLATRYLVAFLKGDHSTFLHEWAHAIYYLDASYRDLVQQEWTQLSDKTQEAVEKELAFRNYDPSVYCDEFQAYVVEGPNELGKKIGSSLLRAHKTLSSAIGETPLGWDSIHEGLKL